MTSETVTYIVAITLTTGAGECPTKAEAEQLIIDQMDGELDEVTGLFCCAVDVETIRDA